MLSVGLVALNDSDNYSSVERAFSQVVVQLRQLVNVWRNVLPAHIYAKALGTRVNSFTTVLPTGWLSSRVVSLLDSGAEGPGFKSQSRCCRITVLGKLFTPLCLCSPNSKIGSSPVKCCRGNCRPGGK